MNNGIRGSSHGRSERYTGYDPASAFVSIQRRTSRASHRRSCAGTRDVAPHYPARRAGGGLVGTKYSGLVGYCFHLSRTQGTRTSEGVFG
ncbi:MAG: hypothetical protein WBX81_08105 [Nitrososphaeraceae archaeon]